MKKIHTIASRALVIFLALVTAFGCVGYLQAQTPIAPENPIDSVIEQARLPIAQAATLAVDEEILDQETDIVDAASDLISDQSSLLAMHGGSGEGQRGEGSSSAPADKEYFRTDLEDGKRVDSTKESAEFAFSIWHLILDPLDISFYQDGEVSTTFSGTADGGSFVLHEGVNTVYFEIEYELSNGTTFKVRSQKYTIYYVDLEKSITIDVSPNKDGQTLHEPTYTFHVNTVPDEIDILQVKCQGSYITGRGDRGRYYTVPLEQGKNVITIYADSENRYSAVKEITVYYEIPRGLAIITDLGVYESQSPLYDRELPLFYVYVTENGEYVEATLTVRSTQKKLSAQYNPQYNPTGDPNYDPDNPLARKVWYKTTLSLGVNEFNLVADDYRNQVAAQKYALTYTRDPDEIGPEGKEPTLYINVSNGQKIYDSPHLVKLRAYDYRGRALYLNGIYLSVNGREAVLYESVFSTHCYYPVFNIGENTLKVTLRDADEYYWHFTYTIIYEPKETREPSGSAAVSVVASTVGLGVLASGTVEIYDDEPASYAVVRFLEQSGYTCTINGTLNYGMYLRYINKAGITDGYKVPEALLSELSAAYPGAWHNSYYTDSLGEHDFTSSSSGWMITINGQTIPGLSNVYLDDGDTICVRYTLAGGRDIGLAGGNNFSQEW